MLKKRSFFKRQVYSRYTDEDKLVWKTLYNKQYNNLKEGNKVVHDFFDGLNILGINDEIPKISVINKKLKRINGWQISGVKGLIDDKDFFQLLREKRFPVTTWIRKMDELDYIEEPDMFHDFFGHVPFLINGSYVKFLERIGNHAEDIFNSDDKDRQYKMSRLYWYTIEFGLLRIKPQRYRIYGSGIVSSYDETERALSSDVPKFMFESSILEEKFFKHDLQDFYVSINKHIKFLSKVRVEEI